MSDRVADVQGTGFYTYNFRLHPIGLPRPDQGSTVATLTCPSCAAAIICVIRDGGAEFLLEPFAGMVAFSAFAILAQRRQREDGVSLRGRPVERLPRTHSLRCRRAT